MSTAEISSQVSQIFMKLNKIRQGVFFSFSDPIAWSLFVTVGYFCEEIIGTVVVECRAPRRVKGTTAFAFTGYPRSAVFVASTGHNFCPLREVQYS